MLDALAQKAAAYPPWVVAGTLVAVMVLSLWFLLKVCKWMLILALVGAMLVAGVVAAVVFIA